MKAGVSIKPNTPVSALEPVLDKTEMFLIMSVEPDLADRHLFRSRWTRSKN